MPTEKLDRKLNIFHANAMQMQGSSLLLSFARRLLLILDMAASMFISVLQMYHKFIVGLVGVLCGLFLTSVAGRTWKFS